MSRVDTLFAPLRAAVVMVNEDHGYHADHPWHHRLTVAKSPRGLLEVEYRGEYALWLGGGTTVTILRDLLRLLASAEVAPRLRSFTYRTDAVRAANGTYEYDIDPLVEGKRGFPNLARLSLDQGEGEHGYKILTSPLCGGDWDESGVLARLLGKAPRLKELTTPAPPNGDFFRGRPHPLRSLDVDAGFGHADFIRHLAGSSRFPDLRRLVFTDFRQDHDGGWREQTTAFEDYVLFFESPIAAGLESIALREVSLTPAKVRRLLELRREGVEITRHR